MMDTPVVETLAELIGLEFEDRHIEGAVTQEHAVREHAVRPPDLLEVERLLVEIGHLLRVFRGDRDVTQLGHPNLLALLMGYPSTTGALSKPDDWRIELRIRARFLPTRKNASSHGNSPNRSNSGSEVPLGSVKREAQVRVPGSGRSGGFQANSARALPRR